MNPKLTKKNFERIAEIIKKYTIEDVDLGFKEGNQNCIDDKIIFELADYFATLNAKFDRDKFLKGYGVDVK